MFLNLLSAKDRENFLKIAELISLSDKPLLWDGKRKDEPNSETGLGEISIHRSKAELSIIAELHREADVSQSTSPFTILLWPSSPIASVEQKLLARLKSLPLRMHDDPASRAEVTSALLQELLGEKKSELPSVPKLMLFELMLLALADSNISSIEWKLLKDFGHHFQLEDYIFDDLLDRAEGTVREIKKTLSVILE